MAKIRFKSIVARTSDGRGMLLRYVSGYVPNFSDSFTSEWLNDAASDYSVARRVLADYHPMMLCDEDVRKLAKLPWLRKKLCK